MTTEQIVKTSVTVNNSSPIQDYVHPDDQSQPTFEMIPGFKPFTVLMLVIIFETRVNSLYFEIVNPVNLTEPLTCGDVLEDSLPITSFGYQKHVFN